MAMPMDRTELDGAVLHDRRRPGRRDVDPALIPLLRGQGPVVEDSVFKPAIPPQVFARDELGSAVGIARGVFLMCAVWAFGTMAYVLT